MEPHVELDAYVAASGGTLSDSIPECAKLLGRIDVDDALVDPVRELAGREAAPLDESMQRAFSALDHRLEGFVDRRSVDGEQGLELPVGRPHETAIRPLRLERLEQPADRRRVDSWHVAGERENGAAEAPERRFEPADRTQAGFAVGDERNVGQIERLVVLPTDDGGRSDLFRRTGDSLQQRLAPVDEFRLVPSHSAALSAGENCDCRALEFGFIHDLG